ncbi:MAG: chemotaxis protein CheW [Planctomycetia bacterium]|nr:chemotaxis protein CheW [Planctomycetia bacterium]
MQGERLTLFEFVSEAKEHLANVTDDLLALEKQQGDAARYRIDRLFRAMHSVKGGAGFFARRTVEELAHRMETVLGQLRQGRLTADAALTDALLAGTDRIYALLDDIERSNDADIADVCARLRPFLESAPASPLGTAVRYRLQLDLAEHCRRQGRTPSLLVRALQQYGQIIEPHLQSPPTDLRRGPPDGPLLFEAIYASNLGLDELRAALQLQPEQLTPIAGESAPPAECSVAKPETVQPQSVRIHLPLLDRLMSLAGELVLVRNQALQSVQAADVPLRQVVHRLNSVTTALQETVMLTRMQPVDHLFGRFPRLVRDLARQLDKQIELTLDGTEVELDKTILESLSDPLTHLVRNACDHGLETSALRLAAGKPASGRLLLRAHHEGGQIRIEVRDDGRGIDPQAIRRKALEKGLRTAAELDRLSERETLALILLPGLSTAAAVTDVSGRGVGMDVVKTNLEQLGGSLEIESRPGLGTAFHLRLPLTLAIIPCLMVTVDGERFAVPQKSLEEVLCVRDGAALRIECAHDQEMVRLRHRLLPVVRLAEVLQRRRPFNAATRAEIVRKHHADGHGVQPLTFIVVVRMGGERCGLVVDGILGTEEIVVKPLHPLLKSLPCFSGATVLGDGRVSLILDVEGIARQAGVLQAGVLASAAPAVAAPEADRQAVLLFRHGDREQFAVPLSMIRRIEMIAPGQIERVGDSEFVALEGTPIRVVRLEHYLRIAPAADQPIMFLLLPRHLARPIGVLITSLIDSVTLPIELDTDCVREDGVLGSALINEQITLFLDLFRLGDRIEQGRAAQTAAAPRPARQRILLVEDTQFFRQVVRGYLEADGYHVETANHGGEGLERLAAGRFELVISDIEMPVMDGWTFARAVRARDFDVPLLALTTLSSDSDRARAAECGFDRYEVKLDREKLRAAVAAMLSGEEASVSP